jgi:DNA polymerase-4
VRRLRRAGLSGRTIVLKVRRYDFSTLTRSETLRGPTDDPGVVREAAARLLEGVDTTGGVRLLGVGVSGLADYTQEDLFAQAQAAAVGESAAEEQSADEPAEGTAAEETPPAERRWPSGHDVRHAEYGHGWVQGSGLGRVTVRFETPYSEPGRVRTFRTEDPQLEPADPLPLVERRPGEPGGSAPGPWLSVSEAATQGLDPDAGPDPGTQASSVPASRPKSRSGGGAGDATSRP